MLMGCVRFGFAARCEAVAVPRRKRLDYLGLCPWLALSPADLLAQGRIKGVAQNVKGIFTAGHSHRRTSGGKAEAQPARTFRSMHRSAMCFCSENTLGFEIAMSA
jgi:hypothetical protein